MEKFSLKNIKPIDDLLRPVEEMASDLNEYKELKIDSIKLKAIEGLSVSLARTLSIMLMIVVLLVVFISLAFAGVLWLGQILGNNYALGAGIVAGVFLLAFLVLFLLRNRLFVNRFVRIFAKTFYEDEQE